MKENNKPRVYTSEILKDMISKITPEEEEEDDEDDYTIKI